MSTYGTTRHQSTVTTPYSTPASTTLFRRLTWEGTVPLEIRVDSKELPANSDRGLECYFIQAPRVSYLPLLVPEIKRYLMDVVFDDVAAKIMKEEDWWFESEQGTLLKWHWPIGLIYDNHAISMSLKSSSTPNMSTPLRILLHLASPPTDKLLIAPSAEACKQAFMGQLKEADFMRWGNTKRMTGLRKQEQDGMWEGVKDHNFDDYWRVASKVIPTTAPTRPQSPSPSSASMHNRPPSVDNNAGVPDRDGANNVRSVPVRIYLPDGPVLQDLVPPTLENGAPHTLSHYLSTHIPLFFPPKPSLASSTRAPPSSFPGAHPAATQASDLKSHLAYALIQGVLAPAECEMAWLGACLTGADGWLNICIGLCRGDEDLH